MAGGAFFQRLKEGLTKSRDNWTEKLGAIFQNRSWDEDALDRMEETLIASDLGVAASRKLVDGLRRRPPSGNGDLAEEMTARLQETMAQMLQSRSDVSKVTPLSVRPWVIIFLGVNGVGKTTTIGKLAAKWRAEGKKVLLAAGDTFRAAATEQLEIWGQRANAPVVKGKAGGDPSSVIFDAIKRGQAEGYDIVIADTAGRLHTKVDLMEELRKVGRVIDKAQAGAPHETWLVLDSTTGQNAIQQAKMFKEAMEITGIVLTKLDGTAKGGVILGICDELAVPVRFIGIGESVGALREFDPEAFVRALYEHDPTANAA